ncbi:Peptidase S1 [Methyloversatilis universalis FAM5]|jgi:serine protease Do|uniref:Probable periplasmic serine endoprotease DegP-like n=1 Tax=Methyloversatilis universalis (strain ATCC BAA-1314 / DSM 25237 / JCM 13912 / CCUG 52030 / FAM5) TaxID=1000565 RepID=F5R8R3_METUF|nr:DegQ family serine endoprotease [Methyloversatilis universalis]EGK72803.1 Peptidase S1 [Methyloversatilis universalis FAM5]
MTALIRAAVFGLLTALSLPHTAAAQRELPDFSQLVEQQARAVVNISTTQKVSARPMPQMPPGVDEDDPMFDFFRRFIPQQPGTPGAQDARSLGSGFIISADGHLLTNAHVVEDADEITVRLSDKREFRAKVIGADRRTDIALLKIEASGLPVVRFGDANRLKVGEWVVAIGSPFGFESSVTAGIVSAKGRALPQENFVPFIQTDVAINPGNSGGPLFNLRGEVVGINSQIYSRNGGYMGLSFAIPIDVAMDVQSQLRATGRVQRGRIGVVIQEVTRELADSFGLQKTEGALVSSVEPRGPAEKAGIEPGDVILRFDGKPVEKSGDLPRLVGATKPGATSVLQVWRNGAARDVRVTVVELNDDRIDPRKGRRSTAPEAGPAPNRLGLVLSELNAQQKRELKVEGGLKVEQVSGNQRSDLRAGDIILAVIARGRQTPVSTLDQFNRILSGIEPKVGLTVLVRRGDSQTFLTLRAPDSQRGEER